jgi:hypothetical protein
LLLRLPVLLLRGEATMRFSSINRAEQETMRGNRAVMAKQNLGAGNGQQRD